MDSTKRKKDLSTNMNHEAAMDTFLGKLGLYRKPIAKDGSCLFRAVAEQVFNCQAEHPRVRKECIGFMKRNKDRFEAFVEGPFDHHLFNLKSQKEWAGQVEIQALSLMYKCDFYVYQSIDCAPIKATENNFDKQIMLCYSNGNHYDSIYPAAYKKNLALCQSIVFELLYGKVFPKLVTTDPVIGKSTNISEQAEKQVEKDSVDHSLLNGYASDNNEENEEGWTKVKSRKQGKASAKNHKQLSEFHADQSQLSSVTANSSKLHWEIMRSVDPDGYRNIELEAWEEIRKEQQQKDHTVAATIQFKKGGRCLVRHPANDQFYPAVIDDIFERTCKIWIPELKERKVLPFSSLKPSEHGSNAHYRDLSGYHRKQDNGDSGSRGNDDQKTGRRRKSNRTRKGTNENFERSQQEVQEQQAGRPRGDKNRRRRNGNPKAKEEKDARSQGDSENISQDQGFFEMTDSTSTAFPALPGSNSHPETEKQEIPEDNGSNSAAFWRKLVTSPSPDDVASFNQPLPKVESNSTESNDFDDIVVNENFSMETTKTEVSNVEAEIDVPDELNEKQTCWQNKTSEVDNQPPFSYPLTITEDLITSIDVRVGNQEPSPNPPSLLDMTNQEKNDPVVSPKGNFDQDHFEKVNETLGKETNQNVETTKNITRHEVKEVPLSSAFVTTDYEKSCVEQPTKNGSELLDSGEIAGIQFVNGDLAANETPLENQHKENNQGNHEPEHDIPPSDLSNHNHPITLSNLQNEIINGNITFSTDPEGKDLPKDIEIVQHLYNRGVQLYLYYHGVQSTFPGGSPLSPTYPMMSPGTLYPAMHQPYQNQHLLLSQNMCQYPSMQTASQEETQHQQSPGEERREGSGNPGYKQTMSSHQSAQYHQQAMVAQAMFNMNYGQMYAATGHRPVYPNYNMFPAHRANYSRFSPNKSNFNRPANRKQRTNRYDNQQNVKLYTTPSGYGSDWKGTE